MTQGIHQMGCGRLLSLDRSGEKVRQLWRRPVRIFVHVVDERVYAGSALLGALIGVLER